MKVSTTALAGVFALLALSPEIASAQIRRGGSEPSRPAAQQPPAGGQAQAGQRRWELSRAERAVIEPLLAADQAANAARQGGAAADYAPVLALLPAAQAAARGNDAKYLVGRVQLNAAVNARDEAAQQTAIAALLANPATPADEQTRMRGALEGIKVRQAEAAFGRQDFQTAARIFQELATAHPENTGYSTNLAIVQRRLGNSAPLRDAKIQAIRTAEAAGRPGAESDYRDLIALSNQARDANGAMDWAARLAQNYPTPANWTTAITQARTREGDDIQYVLDLFRLAFKTGAIPVTAQSNGYLGFGGQLASAGLTAEARAVLQAGLDANAIRPDQIVNPEAPAANRKTVAATIADAQARAQRDQAGLVNEARQAQAAANGNYARNIGDAYFGFGRYTDAVQMYRLAQTKGGQDANLINTRIGMSLALAGQRAEAETALRAVTGPRADVAKLWLAWLARRTA